jgi:hypothetical protein
MCYSRSTPSRFFPFGGEKRNPDTDVTGHNIVAIDEDAEETATDSSTRLASHNA